MRTLLVAAALFCASLPTFAKGDVGNACSLQKDFGIPAPEKCKGVRYLRVSPPIPAVGKVVEVPNPTCSNPKTEKDGYASSLLKLTVAYYSKDVARFRKLSADVVDVVTADVAKGMLQIADRNGGDVANFMRRNLADRTSQGVCGLVMGYLPGQAKLVGYRYYNNDTTDGRQGPCSVGADCRWGRFMTPPQRSTYRGSQAYSTVFNNWSHDRQRSPEMFLFYKLPKGVVEVEEM